MTLILSLLGGAWGFIKRLLDIAARYPWQAGLIASLCLAGWLYMGRQDARADLAEVRSDLKDEQAAHIATKTGYKNAQKVAADMNRKQVERIESEYAAIAAKSERNYDALLADSRKSVDDFVRRQKAGSATQGTGASGQPKIQPEIAGTGEMPDISSGFAIVPVSDLDLVAGAYAKLWALQDAAIDVGKVHVAGTVKPAE